MIISPNKRMVVYIFEEKVCELFGIGTEYLRSKGRKPENSYARHMLWWMLQKYLGMSGSMLGREYQKDHTTIIYGVRKFEESTDFSELRETAKLIFEEEKVQRLLGLNVKEKPRLST